MFNEVRQTKRSSHFIPFEDAESFKRMPDRAIAVESYLLAMKKERERESRSLRTKLTKKLASNGLRKSHLV